jgi:hypothetical protein
LADCYTHLDRTTFTSAIHKSREFTKDREYIERRFKEEGLSFFTKTLPKYGEYVDALCRGIVCDPLEGFAPYRENGHPRFLNSVVTQVLNGLVSTEQGLRVKDAQTALLYRLLRTLLFGLKKLETGIDPDQLENVLNRYIEVEDNLFDFECTEEFPDDLRFGAQLLISRLLSDFEWDPDLCRQGPGAVSGRERNENKWIPTTMFRSVMETFPKWLFYPLESTFTLENGVFVAGPIQYVEAQIDAFLGKIAETDFPVSRMIPVPKDSRGPRLICAEPKELMYLQQGYARSLMKHIESHRLTRHHINFERQDINQNLALESSSSQDWSTIDLKDASDRVSCKIVRELFPEAIGDELLALRSHAVEMPDKSIRLLKKYAPMGSALCFPVESVVFWSIACAAIGEQLRKEYGTMEVAYLCASESVYVYGDDIIVPDRYAALVMSALESFNLVVNHDKSMYGKHFFRESCGVDAHSGFNVTPFRLKSMLPSAPTDIEQIVGVLGHASNCWSFSPRRARYIAELVGDLIGTDIPLVTEPMGFLSVVVPVEDAWNTSDFVRCKWEPRLCKLTARVPVVVTKTRVWKLDEYSGIQHALQIDRRERAISVVVPQGTQMRVRRVAITR